MVARSGHNTLNTQGIELANFPPSAKQKVRFCDKCGLERRDWNVVIIVNSSRSAIGERGALA
jgi:hypothetical protein